MTTETDTPRFYFDGYDLFEDDGTYWGSVWATAKGYFLSFAALTDLVSELSPAHFRLHDTEEEARERLVRVVSNHVDFEEGVNAGLHPEESE